MTARGIFVDDKEKIYATLLSRKGVLEFDYFPVDADVAELGSRIFGERPIVVALDYRLDEEVGGLDPSKTYKASALAQHLRDHAVGAPQADFSIVLVSAESKIRSMFDPDRTAHDLFDRVYIKEQVTRSSDNIKDQLVGLSNAYSVLNAETQPYQLPKLLAAQESDKPFVNVQELTFPVESASAPHQIIGFFLRSLFDKPGLLLDADDAAARLGIAPESFEMIKDQLTDDGISYTGILGDAWPRWWNHRLESWITNVAGARPITFTAEERTYKISAKLGIELTPATSPWTGRTDEKITISCACCRRGTEARHSVNAFDGPLPRYRTARRICWDCVQTERYLEMSWPLQIDEADQALAERVKVMEKPAG